MHRRSPETALKRESSRRSILRASGAAIAAATSLSGCLSAVPLLDGRSYGGDVDLPPGGSSSFRDWIPADGVRGIESIGAPWVFMPGRDGSEHLPRPMGLARSFLTPIVDYLGIGVGGYDLALLTGDSVVLQGPVDPEAVGETLLDSGYEAAGRYRDFDLYERFDGPRTCAVRSGTAIWADDANHRERVRAHADAGAGEVERRHDTTPAYGRLAEHVGARSAILFQNYGAGQVVQDARAGANGFDVHEQGLYRLAAAVVAPGADPSRRDIRQRFSAAAASEDVDAIEVTIDERVVIMVARTPLDALRSTMDPDRSFPPQVTWGVETEPERYLLRHEAGNSVDGSHLELRGAAGEEHSFVSGGEGIVEPGDTLTVERGAVGPEFRLVWSGETDESVELFEYRDPAAPGS